MANEMKPSNNKLSSRTQCGDLLVRRLPRRVFYTSRNDKKLAASLFAKTKTCGKCVRDGSPLGFGLATCREAERTSGAQGFDC